MANLVGVQEDVEEHTTVVVVVLGFAPFLLSLSFFLFVKGGGKRKLS